MAFIDRMLCNESKLCTFNSNNIISSFFTITTLIPVTMFSYTISSTPARDSSIMRTTSKVILSAGALQPAHCKWNSTPWAGTKTGFLIVSWSLCGSGETQHLADDSCILNVPTTSAITIIITQWAALVINCSTIGTGSGRSLWEF